MNRDFASTAEPDKLVTSRVYADGPRLLADIGGTNARFALERRPGAITDIRVYPCASFPGVTEAIKQYLSDMGTPNVLRAGIAIANPVDDDMVQMTNLDWAFSRAEMRAALSLDRLTVVNDFTALAMALPELRGTDYAKFGLGEPIESQPIGLLGPGTGLGVSGLLPTENGWVPLASEGGHASFSPADERQEMVLAYAKKNWTHVSFERVAAGPGLSVIHSALATLHCKDGRTVVPAEVTRLAQAGDLHALDTVACFCSILGNLAGNLALTLGAKGGIFIGGGVVQKLGTLFDASVFRRSFEKKGRFNEYLKRIPTYRITADYPAFVGIAAILSQQSAR
ncbi:glucokinase [Burkholderia multivorans]|uniref:glucokinase n=1 Tax=Burkholderia multivorans TaxID=87883 RepID=UPI0020195780|nr:glucokinase [Burkholderia multivorans]MCO1368652.1 glucokinase [Burkholderia multivorans]MCO1380543.1 glucokinase [Burkholderia multivorans]MDN8032090.1 glucokinase [Burkholderia multivorans]UQP22030.1 glucokinase [Burkholderia multivorans]UQP91522.1 glucokinase [Burkholderia multivorans]